MKIQDQVCSREQSVRLYELGVDQTCLFHHLQFKNKSSPQEQRDVIHYQIVPMEYLSYHGSKSYLSDLKSFAAYTVAELGEMLPAGYDTMKVTGYKEGEYYWIGYDLDSKDMFPNGNFQSEAHCRAAMLIHLLESKLTTTEEANKRLNQ